MAKAKLRIYPDKTESSRSLLTAEPLFLLSGVLGILLLLRQIESISFDLWVIFPVSVLLCAALWYCFYRSISLLAGVLGLLLVVCGFAVFRLRDLLPKQLWQIVTAVSHNPESASMEVTETILLFAVVIMILMFWLECLGRCHGLLFFLMMALLLFSELMKINITIGALLFISLFQWGFWAVRLPAGSKGSSGIKIKAGIASVLLVSAAFAAACLAVSRFSQTLYTPAYRAEEFVYRMLSGLSNGAGSSYVTGQISRGNHYETGTEHLTLTVSAKPSETLYLRGFSGGDYSGETWLPSNEEEIYQNMAEILQWDTWSNIIPGLYQSMYYVMNENMPEDNRREPLTLTIRHTGSAPGDYFTPYYSRFINELEEEGHGYTYQFFEQGDITLDWENVADHFAQQRDWYLSIRQAYSEQAHFFYTRTPVNRIPRMEKLIRENPRSTPYQITSFILRELHNSASYSTTPGWMPFNEDIVEYFLFESHQGYCVHFASAAVLMYRLYGIPARYASGYAVPPSAFSRQEDGTWQAVVTDKFAHAWAEIFQSDYGWSPVEVTPASDGSMTVQYPGFSGLHLKRSQKDWSRENSGSDFRFGSSKSASSQLLGISLDGIRFQEHRNLFLFIGFGILYSLLFLPLFLDYRRLRKLCRLESAGCREIFRQFLNMLQFCGIASGYDGSEPNFVPVVLEGAPFISQEELSRMLEIVGNAAFGPELPGELQNEFIFRIYQKTARRLYAGLPRHKKVIFRFVKAFW